MYNTFVEIKKNRDTLNIYRMVHNLNHLLEESQISEYPNIQLSDMISKLSIFKYNL